ncbi:hypothetical protein L3Y34_001399 [Caenorhabditis briggsae]|uniref:Uncharacterized protein n=2 Tax=Caenorhabditis briggsae TaxID=6238 RepID=A0AAE9IPQ5_CAEBR|nr:hypothetical protein L3Y34_001399 [Caenorhabditis briggsae]
MSESPIIFISLIVSFLIPVLFGCSKKQKRKMTTPTETEKLQEQKRKEAEVAAKAPSSSSGAPPEADKKKPPKANEPNMAARDANDNETINDAKSDWGELPA